MRKSIPQTTAYQDAAHSELETGNLKHETGKDANIVLRPQPSNDPNDPLNWPRYKKNIIIGIIFLGVIVHGVVPIPLLNPGIVEISQQIDRSITDTAKLGGWLLITSGATGAFASAFGRKYGKRPAYVFSSVLGTISCIVSETANGYNGLLVGRVLSGIAVTAYESFTIASIGDIFFVHERGPRIAFMMFLMAAISNGISIIAGVITTNLGWRYNFRILTPFAAVQTILVILYCPETVYRREEVDEISNTSTEEPLDKLAETESRTVRHTEDIEEADSSTYTVPAKKTFVQEMFLYNGTFAQDSIIKMVVSSLAILLNLGALYQVISTGLFFSCFVSLSILSGVIFASPPYNLTAAKIGYISVGPLVGGLLGAFFASVASWPIVKYLIRKNKGIYEPEFCLPAMVIGTILTVAGLVGFGYAIQEQETVYFAAFVWGMMLFGISWFASFCTQWCLDSFQEYSTEIFVVNMVFKNFFNYGLVQYVIQWYMKEGMVNVAGTLAGIMAAITVMAIPLYIFGKRYRYFWCQHNIFKILKLESDRIGTE